MGGGPGLPAIFSSSHILMLRSGILLTFDHETGMSLGVVCELLWLMGHPQKARGSGGTGGMCHLRDIRASFPCGASGHHVPLWLRSALVSLGPWPSLLRNRP